MSEPLRSPAVQIAAGRLRGLLAAVLLALSPMLAFSQATAHAAPGTAVIARSPSTRPGPAAKRAGAPPALRRGNASSKIRPPRTEVPARLLRRPALPAPSGAHMGPDEAPPPDSQDPDRARILRLQEALSSIVHGPVLGRMRVAIRVVDANSGRTFFRQSGTQLMDPASNQKVLATTAALMRLGGDYRFRTELQGPAPDGEGVINGDVVLRGSGDPSFGKPEMIEMASALAARGVTRIDGGVIADPRRIGSTEAPVDERSPLRMSRASLLIRIRPGFNGGPPLVSVRPALDAILVRNRATTSKGRVRGRIGVKIAASGNRLVVDVTGKIAANHPGVTMSRIPGNQRLFAAALLHASLKEAGVAVKGAASVLSARPTSDSTRPPEMLALHHSLPLTILIRHINKDSNNEWSERLLDVLGAEVYGGPATPDKGLRVLREALDELGVARASYVSTNGSGLGHSNRLTADALADLLRKLYTDPRWGPELMQSLSVGGVDGTTRNRFRGSPAAERVRSKTGTLDGKSCLSGYVGDGEDVLVFSIIVEGPRGRRFATHAVRAAQVGAVNAMMRYARGVLDAPTGEEVAPQEDIESGSDVIEIDADDGPPAAGSDGKPVPPLPATEPSSRPTSSAPAPAAPRVPPELLGSTRF